MNNYLTVLVLYFKAYWVAIFECSTQHLKNRALLFLQIDLLQGGARSYRSIFNHALIKLKSYFPTDYFL